MFFCGLCNRLAADYGLPARLLVNRDATALAILQAAYAAASPGSTLATCCNPWGAAHPLCQSGDGVIHAAAVSVLNLSLKFEDDRIDERGMRWWHGRIGRVVAGPALRQAQGVLTGLRFPLAEATAALAEQTAGEQKIARSHLDFRHAAEPCGSYVGLLMAHAGCLGGIPPARAALAAIGGRIGRAVYWLDATADLAADADAGRFNPLALAPEVCDQPIDARRLGASLVAHELEGVPRLLAAAPPPRHGVLLSTVLVDRLSSLSRRFPATQRSRIGRPWVQVRARKSRAAETGRRFRGRSVAATVVMAATGVRTGEAGPGGRDAGTSATNGAPDSWA